MKPASTIKAEIGRRIKAAREAAGFPEQKDLCVAMGWIDRTSRLSNYEQGIREPDAGTVVALAERLGVNPGARMFGEADTAPPKPVDLLEQQLVQYFRALSEASRLKLLHDAEWMFNQQYPGTPSQSNPFPAASASLLAHNLRTVQADRED